MYGTENAYRDETRETLVKIERALKEIQAVCEEIKQQHAEILKLLSKESQP